MQVIAYEIRSALLGLLLVLGCREPAPGGQTEETPAQPATVHSSSAVLEPGADDARASQPPSTQPQTQPPSQPPPNETDTPVAVDIGNPKETGPVAPKPHG